MRHVGVNPECSYEYPYIDRNLRESDQYVLPTCRYQAICGGLLAPTTRSHRLLALSGSTRHRDPTERSGGRIVTRDSTKDRDHNLAIAAAIAHGESFLFCRSHGVDYEGDH